MGVRTSSPGEAPVLDVGAVTQPSPGCKSPNPRRVAAGRRNRAKRKGLSSGGRMRLQLAALVQQPWLHSTGPRTPEGKARSAQNSRKRQLGPKSVRQVRAELAGLQDLLREMREFRELAMRP
jgi:hypothetical protein